MMFKRSSWWVWMGVMLSAALLATPAIAAPPMQDEPPATATPVFDTLPDNGGRISVNVAYVRAGASIDWPRIGALEYGNEVIPKARNQNGEWVIVDWDDELDGYIAESLVEWHPDFDVQRLPVLVPPPTVTPFGTAIATSSQVVSTEDTDEPLPTATTLPSVTPTNTRLPAATATVETSVTNTASPVAAGLATSPVTTVEQPLPTLTQQPLPVVEPSRVIDVEWITGLLAGLLLAVLGVYGWLWSRGRREMGRYADGFVLSDCPVCQVGELSHEQQVHRSLGIPVVRHTVRCDTCKSVIRQIRSGLWRYTIDPHVNPELTDEYGGTFKVMERDLLDFTVHAHHYEPDREAIMRADATPSAGYQSAIEHLEVLEAEVIAAQEEAAAQEDETGKAEIELTENLPEDETQTELTEDGSTIKDEPSAK